MTTAAGTTLHVDGAEVRHAHVAGPDGYSTLGFGRPGYGAYASLHFYDTADIDAVIAELVALRNEMEPPASGCGEQHPDGYICTRHDDGSHVAGIGAGEAARWPIETAAPERAVCGIRHNAAGHALCTREPGHAGGHKNTRTGDYWPAAVAS